MRIKSLYLLLSVLGFVLPNIYVLKETVISSNILLYSKPSKTLEALFNNAITSAFTINLLLVGLVFFIWSYQSNKKYQIPNLGLIWISTLLFGLAGGLPLYLYYRTGAKLRKTN